MSENESTTGAVIDIPESVGKAIQALAVGYMGIDVVDKLA